MGRLGRTLLGFPLSSSLDGAGDEREGGVDAAGTRGSAGVDAGST